MTLTRRRFLTISAAAASVAGLPAQAATERWRGVALGAPASMTLTGLPAGEAAQVFAAVEREIARLEAIFSLYRDDSEIVRLNRDGVLPRPAAEMLEVLSLSGSLHRATAGAFDPTVQRAWQALAQGAPARALPRGWQHVHYDPREVRFARPGLAITLNGVAQGYVTDRIAALLAARGLGNVLIDIGEVAALGPKPDGSAWAAGIADTNGRVLRRVSLADRALATSAPQATVLDKAGALGHILDPDNPGALARRALVSVSAGRAAVADGLSTALCLLDDTKADAAVAAFGDARIELMI
ncbi:FAD:protein FMN transferase [Seohaeicola saemankumensis]|nr:FAD:protein FMN transferase [Seohaeicola saemankumensis]MCA0872503.1 FAD:protein FMN transferase [Seohaeicola saemankumensis]